jgi:hypothetical protein
MHSIVWFWTIGIHDPAWVQAVASIALVVLSFVTLVVLAMYAWDTDALANSSKLSADAALLNAQALVNAERARIGFDVNEMGRSFSIDARNSGKTSARIMYAHGFTVILTPEETLPSVPIYVGAPDDNSEWIAPGERFELLTAPDRYGLIADLSDMRLCGRIRNKKATLWVSVVSDTLMASLWNRGRSVSVSLHRWTILRKPTFTPLALPDIEAKHRQPSCFLSLMTAKETVPLLQNLFFSENKPETLRPVDLALLTYLFLRQTEDHYIHDSQLTLAKRLGCERQAIGDSVKRLDGSGMRRPNGRQDASVGPLGWPST